ncbi:TKL protein kinase [Aphanomyces astaci]|uniref:TKL protein kinase n=1 Tax=Aphanomyces astaci TaxID=112090 RepID=W4FWG3_APHAT|nr:TKL protein kinase [Aphanomyces astaci]ETV71870.1 TKL protein kinase [Aphanomyces astaci]|eukprot:XP_009838719.1 TKL protein kinase [Aphanomyces astaci]
MGCNESKHVQLPSTQPSTGQGQTNIAPTSGPLMRNPSKPIFATPMPPVQSTADVDWSQYTELEPFKAKYWIDIEDLTIVRPIKSTYMKTEMGNLHGESVLVKSIDTAASTDEIAKSRKALVAEISSMARTQHPNIVGFKGFSISPDMGLVCISEYMESKTLRGLLDNPKQFAKLTWGNDKINYAIDICSALVYMHTLKPTLIHRNVKASKVLLDRSRSKAKLSGFGASRDRSFEQEMTNKIGQMEWSAPELIMDDEDYTEKIDVYSFGVLLTELDTGLLPFSDVKDTMHATTFTNKLVSGALRPKLSPECPAEIAKVVKYCLQQDPHIRPSSAKVLEMLNAAKIALETQP